MKREQLIEAIFATMQSMHRTGTAKFHTLIGKSGITPSQMELLFIVKTQKKVNVKELAAHMHLTPGAVTQLVEGLVRGGYVQREQDTADRRVTHVVVSPEGKQKLADLKQHRLNMMKKIMQSLTTEELEVMLKVQQKMLEHIRDAVEKEQKENETI